MDWPRPDADGSGGVGAGRGARAVEGGLEVGPELGTTHRVDVAARRETGRLHQIRDTTIRITDPVGGAEGWGNCQPIAYGPWPDLGLDADNWM